MTVPSPRSPLRLPYLEIGPVEIDQGEPRGDEQPRADGQQQAHADMMSSDMRGTGPATRGRSVHYLVKDTGSQV